VFLSWFLGNNETLAKAIAATGSHTYRDPNTNEEVTTRMEFYPPLEINLRITDLIAETGSRASMMFNSFESFPFLIISVIFKSTAHLLN